MPRTISIFSFRGRHDLTQKELAKLWGDHRGWTMSRSQIGHLETRHRPMSEAIRAQWRRFVAAYEDKHK